ncbi:tRNA glutamyl-Q(34) synthetase GluQRS [Aestuariibius insulae]|uniref:tRNA glutamyl-Q(34) synthetase GluQRS n=1 Tax=Aestuariibius insulae TaxID=2058287 RepID=UPI00345EF8E7
MRTRFAPSPTGPLHLGHAFSAITAFEIARAARGEFLLRIEDTDRARSKLEFEEAIQDDLHWLGLPWPSPVWRQSERLAIYEAALNRLIELDLVYPCSCTRADINAALSAPQEGVTHLPPDAHVYPGTCRHRPISSRSTSDALRLDLAKALDLTGPPSFSEVGPIKTGAHEWSRDSMRADIGDVVLYRRDIKTAAYHLSVVVDDAAQEITHVIRGMDLFEATPVQRVLQTLLNLPAPIYHHHRLIRDETGKRLAKRDDARAIAAYREAGATPGEIRNMLDLPSGIAASRAE